MSVLVWVHDHFWWLALAVVPCLAVIGWALWAGRYQPVHAAAGLPVGGESWVPWDTDPRFGSMQLDADRTYQERVTWAMDAYQPPTVPPEPVRRVINWWPDRWWQEPQLRPDWREVAHEEDWRDQTAHDLAPAVLDSGPGSPSLAPGPDLGELPGLHEWHDHAPLKWGDEGVAGCPSCEQHWECPEPEPEPGWTVAGRLVETSDEWLRRLVKDAAPGWTYAGTVAA